MQNHSRNAIRLRIALVILLSFVSVDPVNRWLKPSFAQRVRTKKAVNRASARRTCYVPKEISVIAASPEEFLDKIKSKSGFEYRTGISEYWISITSVKKLALRLDSKHRCPHVIAIISSSTPDYYSTEGAEAAQMIYGYIHGYYPCNNLEIDLPGWESKILPELRAWLRKNKISTKRLSDTGTGADS